jgi:hypothetical protein
MAEHWIPAAKARQIVDDPIAICSRLHSGLLKARADLILLKARADLITTIREDRQLKEIPKDFWRAGGHEALEQDWARGDFSTWIDEKHQIEAFAVSIGLFGLLEMVPFEQRSSLARSLSIAGNADWIPARNVRRRACKDGNQRASQFLVEQARLGFISAKAVEAQGVKDHNDFIEWDWEEREWPIPIWFWEGFPGGEGSTTDWELGRFSWQVLAPNGSRLIELSGVHFLKDSVEAILGVDAEPPNAANRQPRGRKPTYDWPTASNAIWGQLVRGDLQPKNQAQIEKAFQAHLAQGDKEPSESTVRPFAKKIWDEYKKA